jgi:hypothetical protein
LALLFGIIVWHYCLALLFGIIVGIIVHARDWQSHPHESGGREMLKEAGFLR